MSKADTVTMTRAEYEALIERIEDAQDLAAAAAENTRVRMLGQHAYDDHLPIELVNRLLDGESPLRVWREHRGIGLRELAKTAEIGAAYLSEIETGKKPGSLDAMAKVARALKISLDDLVPPRPGNRRSR